MLKVFPKVRVSGTDRQKYMLLLDFTSIALTNVNGMVKHADSQADQTHYDTGHLTVMHKNPCKTLHIMSHLHLKHSKFPGLEAILQTDCQTRQHSEKTQNTYKLTIQSREQNGSREKDHQIFNCSLSVQIDCVL